MDLRFDRKTVIGSALIALAFSETLKGVTTWAYPFIILSLLVGLYLMNYVGGYGLKRGSYLFKQYFKLGILPYLLIFIYSLFVIIANHQGSRFMSRSLGSTLIAFMTVVTSAALVFIFKRKAPDVICYGLIMTYIGHIALNFGQIGFGGLFEHMINPLATYENVFELHSVGFTLNLLLIYYIVKKDKNEKGRIVAILIVLYLIMKRIAFLGLVLALLVWFTTDVLLRKKGKKKYILILWSLAIGAFVYILFICMYSNVYKLLMTRLGILNRYLITSAFDDYYEFDIRYIGRGFGFVSVLMPEMDIAGATVAALHNDILKDYIEEGFIGFCIIYYYFFVGAPKLIGKKCTKRAFCCITLLLVYTFVNLLTDNVLDYVSYMCSLFVIYGTIHLYSRDLFPDVLKTSNIK